MRNIAVAVDFSEADETALNHAIDLGGLEAKYTLIHVVETVGAIVYGKNIEDQETHIDGQILKKYEDMLTEKGFQVNTKLGFGKPTKSIPKIINHGDFDILVMGTHGHTGLKDILFGTTVDKLRHAISIPLYIVKKNFKS
jgi:manganese transport protein